jgi:hypothetical protein
MRASVVRGIPYLVFLIASACQYDTSLNPKVVPPTPRLTVLQGDSGKLGTTTLTNPAAEKPLTTYPYRTAISMRLTGTITMHSAEHAYYSAYKGGLDGHGIFADNECAAYVRIGYNGFQYGPANCDPLPIPVPLWEDTAIVDGPGRIFRTGGVLQSADEDSHHGCNNGAEPCYTYVGEQEYVVKRVPTYMMLSGPPAISPGSAFTFTSTVYPQWVRGMKIPFVVEQWRWVVDSTEVTTVNPSGCAPPEEADTNPAVCTRTPTTSGQVEIDAIVNGVEKKLIKTIVVVDSPRICTSKALVDDWSITTQYNRIDGSHDKPHGGRDYAGIGIRGVPVLAAEAGTVVYSADGKGAGNVVVVHSPTINSYYMHMDSIAPGIEQGQQVVASQTLGWVGSTGSSKCKKTHPNCDPSHLHFEQHKPGKDPDGGPLFIQAEPPRGPRVPPPGTRVQPCFF